MSVELGKHGNEFDPNDEFCEVEHQFIATDPSKFEHFKETGELEAIEQLYLSHPDEPYSLRLRESVTEHGTLYTATLKDRGTITAAGLQRMEVETMISPGAYRYYKTSAKYPVLRKLRAHPASGATIDWNENGQLVVELEGNPEQWASFYEQYAGDMTDQTGTPETSSEALAHSLSLDLLTLPDEITAQEILARIMRLRYQDTSPIVACVSGRSGSGKSTITRQLQQLAERHFGKVVRLSTDDYHQGKKWLEATYGAPWTNWDAPEVYDTKLLALDLQKLTSGQPIGARRFDFGLEETVIEGEVTPSDLIIVEGIYSGSPDLDNHRDLHVAIPTPLATSVGRRLNRDRQEARLNDSLSNLKDILRYQLEIAEPMYQRQSTLTQPLQN